MQDQELYNYIRKRIYKNGSCAINKLKQVKLSNGKIIKTYINSKGYIHCLDIASIERIEDRTIITYDNYRFTGQKEFVFNYQSEGIYDIDEEGLQEELLSWGIKLNDNNNEGLQEEYYNLLTHESKTLYQIGFDHIIEHENFLPDDCTNQEIIDIGKSIIQDYQEYYERVM